MASGSQVHLAHPLGAKGFAYRRVKNDERDAADLVDLLRMGRLPQAWVTPPEVRGLREALRSGLKCRQGIRSSIRQTTAAALVPITDPAIASAG
jgi:transposase